MKIKLELYRDDGKFEGSMETPLSHEMFNIIAGWIRRKIRTEYKFTATYSPNLNSAKENDE